jgi:hypothetical protein
MVAEKKTRRIEHKGRVIEIALTDDEFKTWPSDPDLLDFLFAWKDDWDRKEREYDARGPDRPRLRRFKVGGEVMEYPCTNAEYFRLATDRTFQEFLSRWSRLSVRVQLRILDEVHAERSDDKEEQ